MRWSYALELAGAGLAVCALTGCGIALLASVFRRTCPECGARC